MFKAAIHRWSAIVAANLLVLGSTGTSHAVPPLSITLRPTAPEGSGFGMTLLGTTDLTVNLVAPAGYVIDNPPPSVASGGSSLWTALGPAPPCAQFTFQALGVRRADDHGADFHGFLKPLNGGPGGVGGPNTDSPFDAAVADLQLAQHEITLSDRTGIYLAPTVQGGFPSPQPANAYGTAFTLNTHWAGDQSQAVGTLAFPDASGQGIGVYYNGSLLGNTPITIYGGGLSGTLKIAANQNFTAPV